MYRSFPVSSLINACVAISRFAHVTSSVAVVLCSSENRLEKPLEVTILISLERSIIDNISLESHSNDFISFSISKCPAM